VIPKRAIFFWEGPEPSWLRKQSWESFARLNPTWEIDIVDGEGSPIEKNGDLSIAHRSDYTRYKELNERGGVYFDTDIVFVRPIPDEWLDAHLLLPMSEIPGNPIANVAMLGSVPGDAFFSQAVYAAEGISESKRYMNYQDLGINLLIAIKSLLPGREIKWFDPEAVIPVPWTGVSDLWNDTHDTVPSLSFGVHWFGGDPLTKKLEPIIDPAWIAGSNCMVAKAVRMSERCHA